MLLNHPTRSLREMYDSKAPDYLDTDDDAEERERRNAEYCDFLLDERRERE